jgi:hypothetical protein
MCAPRSLRVDLRPTEQNRARRGSGPATQGRIYFAALDALALVSANTQVVPDTCLVVQEGKRIVCRIPPFAKSNRAKDGALDYRAVEKRQGYPALSITVMSRKAGQPSDVGLTEDFHLKYCSDGQP